MGDRAIIHLHNGSEVGPALYVHWCGGEEGLQALLDETATRMQGRWGDTQYCTARLIARACVRSGEANLSVGCWNLELSKRQRETLPEDPGDAPRREVDGRQPGYVAWDEAWEAYRVARYQAQIATIKESSYSHGDAGVLLVDCRDWTVESFHGYAVGVVGHHKKVEAG